jgi:hypothetical protein
VRRSRTARGAMPIAAQRPAFSFAETTPHAVRDLQPQREVEAFLANRAPGADRFRVPHRFPSSRKEVDLTGVPRTFGELLPGGREIGFAQDVLGEVGFGAKSHQRRFSVARPVGKKRTRV